MAIAFVHMYICMKTVRLISLQENIFRSKTAEHQWGGGRSQTESQNSMESLRIHSFLSKPQYRTEKANLTDFLAIFFVHVMG